MTSTDEIIEAEENINAENIPPQENLTLEEATKR